MTDLIYSEMLKKCRSPLKRDSSESVPGLFEYAAQQSKCILSSVADLKIFSELHADIYDAVFAGRKSVSAITHKRYGKITSRRLFSDLENCVFLDCLTRGKAISVCCAKKSANGTVSFLEPVRITVSLIGDDSLPTRRIKKKLYRSSHKASPLTEKIIKRGLAPLKMRTISALMRSAENDRRFLARYNEETFFRGIHIGKKDYNDADLFFIFTSDSYNRILDMKQKPVRTAFSALYGISEKGFTLKDIYSVGSVFSAEEPALLRENERKRSELTSELISTIKRGSDTEILNLTAKMGLKLLSIELPKLDVDETTCLAENYTLYAGITNLGACFLAATLKCREKIERILGSDARRVYEAAKFMSRYQKVLDFCDSLCKPDNCLSATSESDGYREAALIAKTAGKALYISEVKL